MTHQEDTPIALLHLPKFLAHSRSPFRPAQREHLAHMAAMSRQEQITSREIIFPKDLLDLYHVPQRTIQPMNKQHARRGQDWLLNAILCGCLCCHVSPSSKSRDLYD